MIVPFDTGNFAGFATDARRHVDVFADFLCALGALAGHGSGMGRDFLNLKCLWITHFTLPSCQCSVLFTIARMLPSGSLNHAALIFPETWTSPSSLVSGKS